MKISRKAPTARPRRPFVKRPDLSLLEQMPTETLRFGDPSVHRILDRYSGRSEDFILIVRC